MWKMGYSVTRAKSGQTAREFIRERAPVELVNQIAKGLKFDLATSLLPEEGAKSVLLTAIYKQPGQHSRAFCIIFKVRNSVFRKRVLKSSLTLLL